MENVREEICIRCKGTGSLLKDRMTERLKGAGVIFISFIGLLIGIGFVSIIGILFGIIIFLFAQVKKCSACHGKGKIELITQIKEE